MTPVASIKTILVAASSKADKPTIAAAFDLADRLEAEVAILLCVRKPPELNILARMAGQDTKQIMDRLAAEKRAEVQQVLDRIRPGAQTPLGVTFGEPFVEVIRRVIADDIGMVVKSAEPLRNIGHLLFSSADQHLVRKCPCPVWLRLPDCPQDMTNIVAAVDLDEWDAPQPETLSMLNRRVLDMATLLAQGNPAVTIHVVNAWDAAADGLVGAFSSNTGAREASHAYTDEIIARHSAAMDALVDPYRPDPRPSAHLIETQILRGTPREVITDHARQVGADVVVMGTVARTGLSGIFIGNTAEDMLNSLQCSVVTVKPDGFASPLAELVSS